MAVNIETLREYVGLPPDASSLILEQCLAAARSKAKSAGLKEFKNNAQYDLFLCALATYYYENRGLLTVDGSSAEVQAMINSFVLELRHAPDSRR